MLTKPTRPYEKKNYNPILMKCQPLHFKKYEFRFTINSETENPTKQNLSENMK